jgi:low affinity Fe/Cu permease
VNEIFHRFSTRVSKIVGSPWTFVAALLLVLVWIVTGPVFKFSDAWQLVINTGTTIITFLMVFVIQNSQNRESAAMQLKLDELIRAVSRARNNMVNLEELSDEELTRLQDEFRRLRNGIDQQSEIVAQGKEKNMTTATWKPFSKHGDLDSKDRKELPDSVYAFPKQRKEPMTDAEHVRNAMARFDQVQDVSDEEREQAFQNIKKAAKHFGIDMEEDNWRQLGKKPHTHNSAHS